ncbi:MAG: MBL fold metallo-hydrolase [Verrucomicrobia bacterium]|nr:MBL fold metallo-hydrolase [Verrucomicrobiota bacterium]
MKIFSQELGVAATNTYLFFEEDLGKAVVFDAPEGAFDFVQQVREEPPFELEALYLTHGHYDHILDAWKFAEAGVPVYGHRDDQALFEEEAVQKPFLFGDMDLRSVKIDHWLAVGEPLEILGHSVDVRHVCGHCPGNVLFHFAELKLAIVGDAIFSGSVGRVDLPGGDWAVLENSIRTQIYTLPDETQLLSGHGPVTSVQKEKATNPFVSG